MRRTWLAPRYVWTVAAMGLALWVWTLFRASPWLHLGEPAVVTTIQDTAVFMVLTILSTLSPIETRAGGVMSVNLAPCFGAVVLPLDPWAVMTVAALGTVDQRIPGKDIGWDRFAFNRGGFTLAYGVPSLLLAGPLRHDAQLRPLWMLVAAVIILSLNTLLTATAVSLIRGSTLIATIRTGLAGNALTYLALPLTGVLIAHLIEGQHFADRLVVFLLYAPLLIYRASIQKQRRLDTWLRDSYIMQSRVVDKRDGQTFGHSQRVGELSERVARILKLADDECNTIRVGGILHDLGKIAIPDSILLKPGKLTPEEYEIIKTHPVEGAQILAEHPEQKSVSEIVHHHHERWDGAGYPDGLSGEAIPIGSRIVNAVDAFDTITQARVFRPTVKTPLEAISELRQLAGTWYDPKVIEALEIIVAERWGVVLENRPARAKPVGYKDVLAIRPFRTLWVGQAISYFGDMMNTTGLAIMLYLVTHSPSLVALGLISKAAPTILFGLVAGPVVDRTNRQRLMIGADLIRAPLTISIPFFAAMWLPGVFICVFLIAVASAFFNPAKQAILPNLVPNNLLPKANGMILSSEKAMELLAYSSAGLIVVAVSWLPLFIIDGATYIVSAVSLLGIADKPLRRLQPGVNLLGDIREGMDFVVKNATLRSTLSLTFFAVFFAGLVFPVLVVMAYGPLHGGAFGYGLLEAAIGAGAIVGALVAADAMNRLPAGTLILGGVAGWGVAAALTGFAQSIWLAIVFLLASGAANMLYYVPLMSVTQHEAPDRIRGRVMASRFLIVQSALLLGMASSGPLTNRIGAPMVLVTAGTLLVIASLLGLAFPTLRDATVHKELPQAALEATASAN